MGRSKNMEQDMHRANRKDVEDDLGRPGSGRHASRHLHLDILDSVGVSLQCDAGFHIRDIGHPSLREVATNMGLLKDDEARQRLGECVNCVLKVESVDMRPASHQYPSKVSVGA